MDDFDNDLNYRGDDHDDVVDNLTGDSDEDDEYWIWSEVPAAIKLSYRELDTLIYEKAKLEVAHLCTTCKRIIRDVSTFESIRSLFLSSLDLQRNGAQGPTVHYMRSVLTSIPPKRTEQEKEELMCGIKNQLDAVSKKALWYPLHAGFVPTV